ncbi:MAG: hypothetical protein KDA80_18345 [Planctomycetaceae bacterium]|nr:hypothetical protein [Planctomycetaceae bacterium]
MFRRFVLIATLCVLLAGAVVSTLLLRPAGPDEPLAVDFGKTRWQAFVEEHFAFDEACRECHHEQFEAHQRSGHSRTATRMEQTQLADILDGTSYLDPRREVTFEFSQSRNGLTVATAGEAPFPVHWLLGSGAHARTPVSIDPASGYGVEFRWSWISHSEELALTPDHQRFDKFKPHSLECYGRPLDPEQALACVTCHMMAVPPKGVRPTVDEFYPNVGCERCHGPRKEHVWLAHLGRAEEAPPLFHYNDPSAYLKQCAECHRDETNIPRDAEPSSLARYQPYGLQKSRCFQVSESLTCSTCHDPHDQTSVEPGHYNSVCLQCHGTPPQPSCSAEPAGKCVDCHMPAMEWEAGIRFHDHWIRIINDADKPQEAL